MDSTVISKKQGRSMLGKIKSEHHDIAHFIPCVPVSSPGINVWSSLAILVERKATLGFKVYQLFHRRIVYYYQDK